MERDLAFNRRTGNFVDEVAAAYDAYKREGGDFPFQQWHDSKACPAHERCSACGDSYDSIVRKGNRR